MTDADRRWASRARDASFVSILSFFGSAESSPQELTTVDGGKHLGWRRGPTDLPTPPGSRPESLGRTWPTAAKAVSQPISRPGWSRSFRPPCSCGEERTRAKSQPAARRPPQDRARRRRYGCLDSCQRPSGGKVPPAATQAPPIEGPGGQGRHGASRGHRGGHKGGQPGRRGRW